MRSVARRPRPLIPRLTQSVGYSVHRAAPRCDRHSLPLCRAGGIGGRPEAGEVDRDGSRASPAYARKGWRPIRQDTPSSTARGNPSTSHRCPGKSHGSRLAPKLSTLRIARASICCSGWPRMTRHNRGLRFELMALPVACAEDDIIGQANGPLRQASPQKPIECHAELVALRATNDKPGRPLGQSSASSHG